MDSAPRMMDDISAVTKEVTIPLGPVTTSSQDVSSNDLPIPGPDTVTLTKAPSGWFCSDNTRLRNNLFAAVGFLELANAGDFAANVWNDVPVPVYAIVFMAIGGCSAFVISVCAFFDSRKAWRNIKFLRQQRASFKTQKQSLDNTASARGLDVLIEVTTRELRIEIINRYVMDLLMGGGAMLISIGTFMAIGGANPRVWLASNILSGYLGNAPIALYGLLSSIWAAMVVGKMRAHVAVARKELQGSSVLPMLKRRCFNVQLFFIINGTANVLGGVGSMLTAERWWAYVILIPVIISSIFCNIWWRHRVGYDRPYISNMSRMNLDMITETLEATSQLRQTIHDSTATNMDQLFSGMASLRDVLELFVKYDLFEQFCLRMVTNKRVKHLVLKAQDAQVQISVASILEIPEEHHPSILAAALVFLKKQGPRHMLHRERFLIEILGTYLNQEKESRTVEVEK
ncbi:hypothetical protein KAF25_004228 [Fusarium avenaceum]|uniref:Integral membrane protein n=1 Tax=Fusarium avenaceum TaxID=40199 RepID=A0A9P7H494_9HYPO|nr:hypothetical protein KAF25_004228 [Fusarium avenaceum]